MNTAANKAYAIMLPFMTNKNVIEKRVDLRRIDTDIGNKKRVARRIPRPLHASQTLILGQDNLKIIMSKIIGFSDYNISEEQLRKENPKIRVSAFWGNPDYAKLLKYPPKNRLKKISSKLRESFADVQSKIQNIEHTRIGKKKSPRGILIELRFEKLLELEKLKSIESIYISSIEDTKPKKRKKKKSFYSVVLRIVMQEEGKKRGTQKYEIRILLVKAKSFEKAIKKAKEKVKENGKVSLNSRGRLFQWKLDKVIDCFETDIEKLKNKKENEVYSILKVRKMKQKFYWKPKWKE